MSLTVVFVHLNEVGHPLDRVLQGMHHLLCLWPTYVLCFFCVSANEAACKPANFNLSKRCLTTLAMMMALKRVRMWYDDDTVEAHQGGTSTTPLRVTCCRRQSINGCTWWGCCWQSDHTKPWWNISTIMKISLCYRDHHFADHCWCLIKSWLEASATCCYQMIIMMMTRMMTTMMMKVMVTTRTKRLIRAAAGATRWWGVVTSGLKLRVTSTTFDITALSSLSHLI